MVTTDISSGSATGLMSFLDFMSRKGYATPRSMGVLKSAARQVFGVVEGDDYGQVNVADLDLDEYLSRFENRSMGRYSAKSLAAYRSRFRRAIESYRKYLGDPNWMPAKRSVENRRTNGPGSQAGKPDKGGAVSGDIKATSAFGPSVASAQTDSSTPLITYPFPLRSGQICQLHLPTQLDRNDAERLVAFIRALVFELSPAKAGEQ
jgi:hypothetical protein